MSHLEAPVESVLHDLDELVVRQGPVSVRVEQLEDGVHDVRVDLQVRAHLHGAPELV